MSECTTALQIRSAALCDASAIALLHNCSWSSAYKGLVPDEVLGSRKIDASICNWQSTISRHPENVALAENGDDGLLGFCCSGPVVDTVRNANFDFEIYGLHVNPSCYRQGVGTALLAHSFKRMKKLGLASAIVWTLQENLRSRQFYEKNGGKLIKSGIWNIGGYSLNELAYGWCDTVFLADD